MRTQPCSVESVTPLREKVPFEPPAPLKVFTLEDIVEDVAMTNDVPTIHIKGKSRGRKVVIARFIVCYVAYEKSQETLKTIGEYLGGRDHTTIIHARDKVQQHFDTQDALFMAGWNMFLENSQLFKRYDFKCKIKK